MNWIKENKFLFSLLVVVMLGVIGGGVMLYLAYSKYDAVSLVFEKEAREYNRLRTLKPYPDQKNLAEMNAQKDTYAASIASFRDMLGGLVIKPEPIKKEEFQDRLNKAVAEVRVRAAKSNPPVKLSDKDKPEKFYLGFELYQNQLPKDEGAAAALNRELKAIELIVDALIDSKIDALTTFKRAELPEEKPSQQQTNKGKANATGSQQPLVVKRTLDLAFVSDQNSFRSVLNKLTSSKKQFLITRLVQVRNTVEKGPSRVTAADVATPPVPAPVAPATDAAAPAAPDAPATPAPVPAAPDANTASASKYIVGEEKVSVTMKLEIVDFPVTPTK